MISIEEIKEKQEELNKMIEEYESQNEVKVELMLTWDKKWKPRTLESVWLIDTYNEIIDFDFKRIDGELDEKLIKHNRVFQTKELAEKWLEIDTYLREKSFKPDWNDKDQYKYYIYFNYSGDEFYRYRCCAESVFPPFYFKSVEIIDEILEKYTKEELKFYFNIGE